MSFDHSLRPRGQAIGSGQFRTTAITYLTPVGNGVSRLQLNP